MPQSPFQVLAGKKPDNTLTALNTDADGNLIVEIDIAGSEVFIAKDPSGDPIALNADADGTLATTTDSGGDPAVPTQNADGGVNVHITNLTTGWSSTKNITAATLIKAAAGFVGVATVVVAGSGSGTINDCATTGAAAASNAIATLSDTAVNTVPLNFPCATGIVVVPGAGQTIALSWK